PAREAGGHPVDPGRRPPRRDQPATAAEGRRRTRRRGRGDGDEHPHRRPDPRGARRGDHRRRRRGRVLPDADVHAGADRARARRERRPRDRCERGDQQARLPRLARAGGEAQACRGRRGRAGGRAGCAPDAARGGGTRRSRAGRAVGRSAGRRGRLRRPQDRCRGVDVRRIAAAAVVIGLAVLGGTARADTFAIVDPNAPVVPGLTGLPSAELPNPPGGITVPLMLSAPPAQPQQLDWPQLQGLWQSAGAAYGIPWQVLASINKIESNLGRNMGPSSAGAIGWMQFMPSTWMRWGTDANGARVLSDRLAAGKQAARLELSRRLAVAEADRRRARLATAEQELEQARTQSQPASFSPGAGMLLQAPSYSGNWVFPVGGGPSVV